MNFYFVFICGDSPVCAKGFGTGGFSTNDTVEPYKCRGGSCFYIEVAAVDCGFGLILLCQMAGHRHLRSLYDLSFILFRIVFYDRNLLGRIEYVYIRVHAYCSVLQRIGMPLCMGDSQ